MAFPYILYLLLPFASAIVLLVLAAFAFRRRRTSGAVAFGLLMLAACEWKLAYGLGLIASGLQPKLFLHNLEYVGVAAVSVAWLAFVVQYTGFRERLSWRKLLFLGALPLLTLALVWTNGVHGLVWTKTWGLSVLARSRRSRWIMVPGSGSSPSTAIAWYLRVRSCLLPSFCALHEPTANKRPLCWWAWSCCGPGTWHTC